MINLCLLKRFALQKAASSKDNFFLEQLLAGLVSARAIPELIKLSQAPGMFAKVMTTALC